MIRTALAAGMLLALAGSAHADDNRRSDWPAQVTVTVNSDHCPVDIVPSVSPDHEAVTLGTNETLLHPGRRSIDCLIGIDYSYPAGWRIYRPGAILRGFSWLTGGQRAVWAVRTRINHGPWRAALRVVEGPVNDNLQLDLGDGERDGEPASACGATSAHIDVELVGSLFFGALDPEQQVPVSSIDAIDTAIDWDHCF